MRGHGQALYDHALDLARRLRADIEALDGMHVHGREDFCAPGRAFDLDPLQLVIDISALGVSGYAAADWLHDRHQVDLHVSDHRRISAQLSHADDSTTAGTLLHALTDLAAHADALRPAAEVAVPDPADLRLEQVLLPRDAFFAPCEQVPVDKAAGRIAAEMLTPYPPGIPVAVPGERLTAPVLEYLRSGVAAGMVVPDAADPDLATVRVTQRD